MKLWLTNRHRINKELKFSIKIYDSGVFPAEKWG